MKKIALGALCVLFSLFINAQENPYVQGEIILMVDKGVNPSAVLNGLNQELGNRDAIRVDRTLSRLSNIHLLTFDPATYNQKELLEVVQRMPNVRAAQMNHFIDERATVPNDPNFGNQWHHIDASDNDIDSDLAWDITTGGTTTNGDEIVVCVIEGGGSNYNHQDLIGNHWTNTGEIPGNGVDDDGNGYVDDVNGWNPVTGNDNVGTGNHGTAVSGMIGAKGNNGIGVAGVNWDVKIMQVGLGSLSEANVIASYDYPYTMRTLYNSSGGAQGAFVVATNASWGIDGANPANYPAWCAFYDDLGAAGILNCGATANNNVNIDVVGDMPTGCSSDYMIAVTATNSSDVRTFSGYGATTIDLGAPGESVYLPSGSTSYSNTSGTSFASPCVAGAIALIYSAPCSDLAAMAISNPQAAADLVRGYILNGVDPVANLAGECVTGGRLNVRNSIDLALGNCGPLPPCDPVGMGLSTDCYYNSGTGQVEASITVSVTMSEAFCSATQVCFRPVGGTYVCDDLASLGVNLNNTTTYDLMGLMSNTTYEVYYSTADGTSAVSTITTGDCSSQVPGCTDPVALNYDPAATFDDGSCTFPCVDVTLTLLTDCWGGETSWEVVDAQGNIVASVSSGTYGNQTTYTWTQCLEYGCYTFNIGDTYGDGMAGSIWGSCGVDGDYSMTDAGGNVLFNMTVANFGTGTSHNFCVPTDLPGCTDPAACNYSAAATTDDGSCEYLSCAGCTNAAACNYDATATIDDGSCVLPDGCTDAGACNYNAAATCDDGSCEYLTCAGCTDATACNYDATATQDDGSCEYLSCAGCTNAAACNYDPAATQDDGSCILPNGCTDPLACNYDPAATCDDGSCQLPDGCTDNTACNYDPAASCDDGSCEYLSCAPCPGDFNSDGQRDVNDMLMLLSAFGCPADCGMQDMDDDGIVGSSDVLMFLGVFGTFCP